MSDGIKNWIAAVLGTSFIIAICAYFGNNVRADTFRQKGSMKNSYEYIQEAHWSALENKYIRNKQKIWIIDRGDIYR